MRCRGWTGNHHGTYSSVVRTLCLRRAPSPLLLAASCTAAIWSNWRIPSQIITVPACFKANSFGIEFQGLQKPQSRSQLKFLQVCACGDHVRDGWYWRVSEGWVACGHQKNVYNYCIGVIYRIHILYQLKTNIATECNVISYHIISYQGIHHVNCGGCQVFWFLWEAFLGYSLPFQAAAFFVVGLSVYYFRGAPERDWERVGLWQIHKWHSDEMKQYANTCKSC